MKQCKKLTREQKIVLSKNGLDATAYAFVRDFDDGWLFMNKSDQDDTIVCYPKKKGIYKSDGTTITHNN